jgi:hypothetical protein
MSSATEPADQPNSTGPQPVASIEDTLNQPVDTCYLTARAQNVLTNAGIRTVGDLVRLDEKTLRSFPNCGRKTIAELQEEIKRLGLNIGANQLAPVQQPLSLASVDELSLAKLHLRITELGLRRRALNVLSTENIEFVGDLVQYDRAGLRKLPNCGRETIDELEAKLSELGFNLGTPLTGWDRNAARELRKTQDRKEDSPISDVRRSLAAPPPANSLENELRNILASVTSDRDAEIAEKQLGWGGAGARTLDAVGQDYRVTRERIRQIVARTTDKVRARKFHTPYLTRALQSMLESLPATASALAEKLQTVGISETAFDVTGIKTACEVLGHEFGLIALSVGGRKLYAKPHNAEKIAEFYRLLRRLTSRGGCANFDALCDELKFAADERQNFRIIATLGGLGEWLDREQTWLFAPGVSRNRLFNLISKVLSVTPSLFVSELKRAVSRSRRLEVVPPAAIIASLVVRLGLGMIEDDRVTAAPGLPNTIEPAGTEAIFVNVMRKNGPILAWDRFQELCLAEGMNPITFGIYLSGSPIIARVARGIYSLVGAEVPPGRVEELEHEIAAARRPAEWGWSRRGTLWYALRLSGAVLNGAIAISNFVADFVDGEWQPRIGNRDAAGRIKCNGRFLWGLRGPVMQAGGEPGDICVLEFDIGKRVVNLMIGGDELVDVWETGDIEIPTFDTSDEDEDQALQDVTLAEK